MIRKILLISGSALSQSYTDLVNGFMNVYMFTTVIHMYYFNCRTNQIMHKALSRQRVLLMYIELIHFFY